MADPLFQQFTSDFSKSQPLDFFSFHSNPEAPHPDLFESELDCLAALGEENFQLYTVDSSDAFTLLRADTPVCGPPSTITVSTESAYESISSSSDLFSLPISPYQPSNYSASSYSFNGLDMEFQAICVDGESEFSTLEVTDANNGATIDPHSFNTLPPNSPLMHHPSVFTRRSVQHFRSQSEYDMPSSRTSDFLSELSFNPHLLDPSPVESSVSPPSSKASPAHCSAEDDSSDPRRKYRCAQCPRAFARAFNLKTHMATHDPNRPKPHVCHHRSCGRSFSRKHDLGRHLVSIHRDSSSSHHAAKPMIGVDKAPRGWCETCGKGWVGRTNACDCCDVK